MTARLRTAFLAAILLAGSALAQLPKMEPGPPHRKLDFLVGEWTVDARLYMGDEVHHATHASVVRWLPGGVWLDEQAEMPGTPIGDLFGSARIAWDERAEQYVRYWTDGQSPIVLPMRGGFTKEGSLEFAGSFEWIDGTVYHQRLEIRETPDGWKRTGYLGTDPDNLQLNHEEVGRRVAEKSVAVAASAAPPDWLTHHMQYMTRLGGRWIADNARYRSDDEPFDAYGTEWSWGAGKRSIRGRLFGLRDGEEQGTLWEFRLAWHPAEGRAVVQQFGAAGMATGTMALSASGRTRIEQTLFGPDGSETPLLHHSTEVAPNVHITESFDVAADGSTTPRRSYTWQLEVENFGDEPEP